MAGRAALGGLAQGLARGMVMGQQLDMSARREKRDAERYEILIGRQKKMDAAFAELADLAERFTRAPQSGDAALAAGGIGAPNTRTPGNSGFSAVMPGVPNAAPGVEIKPVMSSQPPEARPLDEASAGPDVRSVIARSGVNAAPATTAAAPAANDADTNEARLGYQLIRQPVLFEDTRFLEAAGRVFIKSGVPELADAGMKWLRAGSEAQKENAITAARLLLQGDTEGAMAAFNSTGTLRVQALKPAGGDKWEAELANGQRRVIDARRMYRAFLSPREFFDLEQKGEAAAATAAHRERTASETERHNRESERTAARNADLKLEVARLRSEGRATEATALMRNTAHLVRIRVAKDEADAFRKLRSMMGKSEEDAILDLTKTLLGKSGYFGANGTKRAQADAREIVRSIRGGGAPAPGGTYKSADDVKAAYRAGQIDRATAIRQLGAFGYEAQ